MLTPNNIEQSLDEMFKESPEEDLHELGFKDFQLSPAQKRFVNTMVAKHGGGVLFRSKKYDNIELQIAAPHLLETDGDKELLSRHLFVNVDKAVNEGHNKAARCVKDGKIYDIRELLSMLPIEDRALNIQKSKVKRRISVIDKLKYMVRDKDGNLIPPPPGEVIPLNELPPDHVAVEYVVERGFSPDMLVEQFNASYCIEENAESFYKVLPGGFKATPRARIVFYISQLGTNRGWQARRLDRRVDNELQFFHPYKGVWETVANYNDRGMISIVPRFSGSTIGKAPGIILKNKYIIGLGVEKSMALMGFDAALKWSKHTGIKTIGIVEGVLDAARLGPPFVSIMGLRLSSNQASLITNHFDRVVYTPDNDEVCDEDKAEIFCKSVTEALLPKGIELVKAVPPKGVEDAGAMNQEQVNTFRKDYGLEN